MRIEIIGRGHAARPSVEQLARTIYAEYYEAEIPSFPETMVGALDVAGRAICVAGLRSAQTGFFSEVYLDSPVENRLSELIREPVARDRILEVTTLAATRPGSTFALIDFVIAHALEARFRWGLFTATRTLRTMLGRGGIALIDVAGATRSDVSDPDRWGTYYDSDPRVCALPVRPRRHANQGSNRLPGTLETVVA